MLFLFNMLDARLSLEHKLPPFTASYLEHRVTKEPDHGNPTLLCIRQVAERLAPDAQATRRYIVSLSALAASRVSHVFSPYQPPWDPVSQSKFDEHVEAAAVYMNHDLDVDSWGPPKTCSTLFGACLDLAAQFGSEEMVERYLRDSHIGGRCSALPHAASRGRAAMVDFIFNFQIETSPWRFDRYTRSPNEFQALAKALITPDPETWDYIMETHRQYGLHVPASKQTSILLTSAQNGWTNMVRHLLQHGTDPNSFGQTDDETPLFFAAQQGHTDVVQSLLDGGARIQNNCIRVAASKGHVKIVQLLVARKSDITGAVVAAARGGYGDVVKILLKIGANANEEDGELPAIGYAIIAEHISMFRDLVQYSAHAPSPAIRETIVSRATKNGVESMLVLLDTWDSQL